MKQFTGAGALVVAVALLASGCGSPLADEIAKYDPAEVQALEEQAEAANMEMSDDDLLSFLEFRQSCRDIRSGLDALATGRPLDEVVDELEAVLVTAYAERESEMSEYYQEVLDQVRVGDSSDIREFYSNSCTGVE